MATKGKMKLKCQAYRNSGRRQINKDLRAKRHEARLEHFRKRKEEGKTYEYQPPKTKREKARRAKKNVDRRLPIQKLDSLFSRLDNELNKKKLEEKNKERKSKK